MLLEEFRASKSIQMNYLGDRTEHAEHSMQEHQDVHIRLCHSLQFYGPYLEASYVHQLIFDNPK